jgi:predicted Zn-dependent peptidase
VRKTTIIVVRMVDADEVEAWIIEKLKAFPDETVIPSLKEQTKKK